MAYQRTVCIDLDGTIAAYDHWRGPEHFGAPLPGVQSALAKLKDNGWRIIIFTTRGDKGLVLAYLNQHQIPFDFINENPDQPPQANPGKPIADIYIDDRALTFQGDWRKTTSEVETFHIWYKEEGDDTSPY